MTEEINRDRFQIVSAGGNVMEYSKVDKDYLPRKWLRFENLDSFRKFVRSKKFEDLFLSDQQEVVLVTQEGTGNLLHMGIGPAFKEEDDIEELIFESQADASKYVSDHKLLPSASLLDDPSKEQLQRFFNGEKCFFDNARDLYEEYIEKKNSIEASDQLAQLLLGRRYEQKVVEILMKY